MSDGRSILTQHSNLCTAHYSQNKRLPLSVKTELLLAEFASHCWCSRIKINSENRPDTSKSIRHNIEVFLLGITNKMHFIITHCKQCIFRLNQTCTRLRSFYNFFSITHNEIQLQYTVYSSDCAITQEKGVPTAHMNFICYILVTQFIKLIE